MTVPIVTEMTPAASEEISRPLPVRTQRRRRLWLATLVILLVAAVCWRVAAIDGWMRPVVVTGPSMAPTLWGPHFNPVCEACGITQRVVRPQAKDLDAWICSNCGHHQAFPKVKLRAGSSVWLDRGAYWFRSIQRDEMVALEQLEIGLRVQTSCRSARRDDRDQERRPLGRCRTVHEDPFAATRTSRIGSR